jgi:tRNA A-37 threonylcarbamoyl transferase component Bud32
MDFIALYQQHLNLKDAVFTRIDHNDAMVAIVYKIFQPSGLHYILKICTRIGDYLREVHFLKYFADSLPVPRVIRLIPPESNVSGAILMECLSGSILKATDLTDEIAYSLGSILARIHLNRVSVYGDLTQPQDLSPDPRVHFTLKFEEGLAECNNHLPKNLIKECRYYLDKHLHLLSAIDGPCIIHRDFRPGNVIVDSCQIKGIIDWSSGRAGFAEEDFCSMEHGLWSTHPESKKAVLGGYASIRPIPHYDILMPLLRLNKALATVGFMVKRGIWKDNHSGLYQTNRQFIENFF